jgi:hypothetical protein
MSQADPETTRPEPEAGAIAADWELPQRTTDKRTTDLVVDLWHADAIGAPIAVLDPVPRSAGWPSKGWGVRKSGEIYHTMVGCR